MHSQVRCLRRKQGRWEEATLRQRRSWLRVPWQMLWLPQQLLPHMGLEYAVLPSKLFCGHRSVNPGLHSSACFTCRLTGDMQPSELWWSVLQSMWQSPDQALMQATQ